MEENMKSCPVCEKPLHVNEYGEECRSCGYLRYNQSTLNMFEESRAIAEARNRSWWSRLIERLWPERGERAA